MSGAAAVPQGPLAPATASRVGEHAAVAAVAVLLGAVAGWLLVDDERSAARVVAAATAVAVGWSYVACGLAARVQEPRSRLGPVMVAIGLLWFVPYLTESRHSTVFTLGVLGENLYLVGFVYLCLTFPDARLSRPVDKVLVGLATALCTVVQALWLLLADSHELICETCPANALEIVRADGAASAVLQLQRGVGGVLSLLTVVLLVRRWRRASPSLRRAAAPVLWAGAAMFLALTISIADDMTGEHWAAVSETVRGATFAAIPVAVVAVMVQRRLARGAVADLVVELDAHDRAASLETVLARVLHDPRLVVGYQVAGREEYVDRDGQPVTLPATGSGRRTTTVTRHGRPVAVLVHDEALRDDALLASVSAAAGMTLDNERLRAELMAKVGELQASRARLVRAGDAERTRIERDLHDGAQQRLVWLAMALALADAKLTEDPVAAAALLRDAREELTGTLDELRRLTQGLRPPALVERGLAAALRDLGRRGPLPVTVDADLPRALPAPVETAAWFVVSEALANAAKHAHATHVSVEAGLSDGRLRVCVVDDGVGGVDLRAGTGVKGLRDRVEALGGTLSVVSPPRGGTRLEVALPCV